MLAVTIPNVVGPNISLGERLSTQNVVLACLGFLSHGQTLIISFFVPINWKIRPDFPIRKRSLITVTLRYRAPVKYPTYCGRRLKKTAIQHLKSANCKASEFGSPLSAIGLPLACTAAHSATAFVLSEPGQLPFWGSQKHIPLASLESLSDSMQSWAI